MNKVRSKINNFSGSCQPYLIPESLTDYYEYTWPLRHILLNIPKCLF